MGNELSCPCASDYDFEKPNEKKNDVNIIEEVMKGKLSKEDLLFEYKCSNDFYTTKICLTSTKNLESFFLNRNLLIVESKLEINLYYQNIFISNFLNFDSLATILLQFKKEENEKLLNNVLTSNRKGYKTNDYNAIYKVETINFVSNEFIKIKEQILNDLNSQLKKEYRLYGIITDLEELKDDSISVNFSNSVFIKNKTYKILYKKSKITDNLDIRYSVEVLNDRLNSNNISKLLLENKDKTLKSVIRENSNNNKYPFCYFFIFEGNKITPEYDENEFLVVKIDKDKSTSDGFLKDIAEKINSQNNAFLLSIINDLNGFFLVFKIDYSADDFNDEDSNY
jgi:hypothetical protein